MINAHLIGWGKYLPGKIVSNAELAQTASIDPTWIKERTGIESRHFAEAHQATSDLAVGAARAALERAQVHPDDVNLIIVATSTPDHLFPATACLVQNALHANHAAAFDLSAGCSGFVYAWVTAVQLIRAGAFRTALVIGADTTSRLLDWNDDYCAFFGDGAGAIVLTASDHPGALLSFALSADGSAGDVLMLQGGGSRAPLSQDVLDRGWNYGRMKGQAAFRFGLREMVKSARVALERARLRAEDIDFFIPHQSNAALIRQVAEKLHIPRERTFLNVSGYANISSATTPVALCDAIEQSRLQPGDRVLITAFGGGMTSAAVVWEWSKPEPFKRMPFFKRLWHALLDAIAAFRHRLWHFEERLEEITHPED